MIVDPWLETNPMCPAGSKRVRELDLMLLTHGHRDHTADAVGLARATGAHVIAPYELSRWLEEKGLKRVTAMNVGGTVSLLGLSITMVPAVHSSSIEDPMHYGTFPELTGTPARLREILSTSGVEVLELRPGDTFE